MSGNPIWEQIAAGRQAQESPNADIIAKLDELTKAVTGDLGNISSSSPISLGRQAVHDIRKGINRYAATEIPDLFTRYKEDIALGRITPPKPSSAASDVYKRQALAYLKTLLKKQVNLVQCNKAYPKFLLTKNTDLFLILLLNNCLAAPWETMNTMHMLVRFREWA